MTTDLWVNLPVKNIQESKVFFAKIGFAFNPHFAENEEAACLLVGAKNSVVMLFKEATFRNFTMNNLPDTQKTTQALFSIGAESIQEVHEMASKAKEAGGHVFAEPSGSDWMYGCGFADLDGHRWNVLFMDESKIPTEK